MYIYPAVISQGRESVTVYYPDLACLAQGGDYQEAFRQAKEGLALHLWGMIEDGEPLPAPSRLEDIPLAKNEALALIGVDLTDFKPDWSLQNEQER